MQESAAPGRVITFYSYKGGTGRSMALANTAWLLAANGKKVLAIDWDLEAPGLHRYFYPFLIDQDLTASPGVIDFVLDYTLKAMTPPQQGETIAPDWYKEEANILRYAVSLRSDLLSNGRLDFVPAGMQTTSYGQRVSSFNWQNFYENLGGEQFLEIAKDGMRAVYDYVLIDSRTGVSDTSGICTVQMPDVLVVCFTLNNQSIEGASAVAKSAFMQRAEMAKSPNQAGIAPPLELEVYPVPARIDSSELDRLAMRWEYARKLFAQFPTNISEEERDTYWREISVPNVPYYSYEELLAPIGDRPDFPVGLMRPTLKLASILAKSELNAPSIGDKERARLLANYARKDLETKPAEAMVKVAEFVINGLKPEDQATFKDIFLRLLHLKGREKGDGYTFSRSRMSELNPLPHAEAVLGELARAKLIAIESDKDIGERVAHIGDNGLVSAWPRIQKWMEDDWEFLWWRQKLREAHRTWVKGGQAAGDLLQGTNLHLAEGWMDKRNSELAADERTFIEASLKEREERRQREADQVAEARAKEAQLKARLKTTRKLTFAAGSLWIVFVVGFLVWDNYFKPPPTDIQAGDELKDSGKIEDALKVYEARKALIERTIAGDPGDDFSRQELTVTLDRIAGVWRDQGKLDEAMTAFQASKAIMDRLATKDPNNDNWQRDLSVSHIRIGDVLKDQGKLDDAITAFQDGKVIMDRLATKDPNNDNWQRDLSVSHNRIGDVLQDQGKLGEAMTAFQASKAIMDRLTTKDPNNDTWQRGWSVSHSRIGRLLEAQGRFDEAMTALQAAKTIMERLASASPHNSGLQRHLAVQQGWIGIVLMRQGKLDGALAALRQAADTLGGAIDRSPTQALWQRESAETARRISLVLLAQGNITEAQESVLSARAILNRVKRYSGSAAFWEPEDALVEEQSGDVSRAFGKHDEAVKNFEDSRDILVPLTKLSPTHAGWKADLQRVEKKLAAKAKAA